MVRSMMRNLIGTAVVMTAGAWTVSPARGEIPVPTDDTGNDQPADDAPAQNERGAFPAAVLGRLHLANIQEIVMGKRAEKKGQTKEVRDLGTLLVRDHSAEDKRLLAFSKRQKLDVSVTGQTLTEPDVGSGGTFDDKFLEAMVAEHDKSIGDVKKSREDSTDDALNVFLDSVLPVLERHRDMAQQIIDRRRH